MGHTCSRLFLFTGYKMIKAGMISRYLCQYYIFRSGSISDNMAEDVSVVKEEVDRAEEKIVSFPSNDEFS